MALWLLSLLAFVAFVAFAAFVTFAAFVAFGFCGLPQNRATCASANKFRNTSVCCNFRQIYDDTSTILRRGMYLIIYLSFDFSIFHFLFCPDTMGEAPRPFPNPRPALSFFLPIYPTPSLCLSVYILLRSNSSKLPNCLASCRHIYLFLFLSILLHFFLCLGISSPFFLC